MFRHSLTTHVSDYILDPGNAFKFVAMKRREHISSIFFISFA